MVLDWAMLPNWSAVNRWYLFSLLNRMDHLSGAQKCTQVISHCGEFSVSIALVAAKLPTNFVEHKGVGLDAFAEFVRFAAHQHRHIIGFRDQCYLCGSDA